MILPQSDYEKKLEQQVCDMADVLRAICNIGCAGQRGFDSAWRLIDSENLAQDAMFQLDSYYGKGEWRRG